MIGRSILFSNGETKRFFSQTQPEAPSKPVWGKVADKIAYGYLVTVHDPEIAHAISTTIVRPEEIKIVE